eukprot:g438.t1
MTQFILAITSMQTESVFAQRYAEGIAKTDYWDPVYEDTLNMIARLPRVAAYIYRRSFHDGQHIEPDTSLDWAANFAHMLGNSSDGFKSLMRLYMTIHADHEGGNASAHTTHLVGSTLSDPYLSFAGGMTSLAGPLHGLANQEVIKWIFEMLDEMGTRTPSKEQIADYVNKTLAEGKELRYTEDHEWVRVEGDIATIGITDYAQKELDELVYVEVETVGETLNAGEVFGAVEAVKTTSDLYMPIGGEILEFNKELDETEGDNPTLINEDPYDKGWIVKVKISDPSELDALLDAEAYEAAISA